MTSGIRYRGWIAGVGRRGVLALAIVLVSAALATRPAQTQTFTVLYSFYGPSDGGGPEAGLVRDAAGNLYGTTSGGGPSYFGTVFKLDTTGNLTVLYSFGGGTDGGDPYAGLVRDSAGNLYGTTSIGGASNGGTVFKVDTTGKFTVLYSFTGGADGGYSQAGLVRDAAGNLYGTTPYGGRSGCRFQVGSSLKRQVGPPGYGYGCGVIFKLDMSGKETVLHSFTGYPDGEEPYGGLVRDSAGNLYGTTLSGGDFRAGTIFKVSPTGKEKVLYSFTGGADGGGPSAGLIRDTEGNLYGTDLVGASGICQGQGCGIVFKLSTKGKLTVLYSFTGGSDGGNSYAGLVRDAAGNLYGTTAYAGEPDNCVYGCGVVFKVDKTGNETVLHTFTGGSDGGVPFGGLVRDKAGNLYGTASEGGANKYFGTVFEITP